MEFINGPSLRQVMDCLCTSHSTGISLDSPLTLMQASTRTVSRFFIDLSEHGGRTGVLPEAHHDEEAPLTQEAETILRKPEHLRRACEIVRDVAEALDYAHRQGVMHRDIKPENLLLDQDGQVHIIDFGIARFFEEATITHTGQIVGTPLYMSPEQVTGRGPIDHRTDIYSLGIVLYELLTLRPPWAARTTAAVIRTIVTKELPPVSWKNKAVPIDLEAVVHKAAAKDPDGRYSTAADLAADLDRVLAHKEVSARPYRYRYNADEIAATRPWSVLVPAIVFLASSVPAWLWGLHKIFTAFMRTRVSVVMHRDTTGWSEYYEGSEAFLSRFYYGRVMLGLGLIVSALTAYAIGTRLLLGKGWARWLAIVMAGAVCCYSAQEIQTIWTGPKTFVSEEVGVQATIFALSALVIAALVTRSSREWFGLARKIRTESAKLSGGAGRSP
jgi:hypothetical protein